LGDDVVVERVDLGALVSAGLTIRQIAAETGKSYTATEFGARSAGPSKSVADGGV
jgi:hypothetical protein